MGIAKWFMERKKKREVKKFREAFADDAAIYFEEGSEPVSLGDYIAAEDALYASFPDLSIDYDESKVTDDSGDEYVEVDAVLTGTFTGADYIYGDKPAIVATGAAVTKPTMYKITLKNNKITKMVVTGGTPAFFYETVAVTKG